jgi:RND family efflux transporter MFP subunit
MPSCLDSNALARIARQSLAALLLVVALGAAARAVFAQVKHVSSRPSPTMIYEGFTEPRYDIMVAATEIGRIESVSVEVGDRVEAGQEVGHLEDALQASSVRIAQLQTEMTGELEAARAETELHRSRTQTIRKLAADGMARPDELVRAETDLRIAAARLVAAQEQVSLRKLELERYQLQFERRKIRVPMDGVISEVFHKPGEYLTPGDPAVVRLLVMDKLFGVFNVPVEDTAFMTIGSSVKVHLRSSSRTIEATITSIAPDIDGESGTVQVRVELDNSDRRLLSGDRCTLRLAPETTVNSEKRPPDQARLRRTKSR